MRVPSHDRATVRRVERRFARFVRTHDLLAPGRRLIVAVSGGADSLALLHLVARMADRLAVEPSAAYIEHRLRPAAEVTQEREYVRAAAASLGVPFLSAPVAPVDARGQSPEAAARVGRYRALAALAAEADVGLVATGHTRTDQAETVLLRMLRGTGVHGLAAMRPASPWPLPEGGPVLVRPLLDLGRADTAAYCAALGLTPRHDPTNDSDRYQRNRVRRELLPLLHTFNPRIEWALAALAADAALLPRPDTDAGVEITATGVRVALDTLPAGPAARAALLARALELALPGRSAPARAHREALAALAAGAPGRSVALPGGLRAHQAGDAIEIGPAPTALPGRQAPDPDAVLTVPGSVLWSGARLTARVVGRLPPADTDRWRGYLRPEVAARGLTVGARRPGDRIVLAGLTGRKRLQDLFVDEKTPRSMRAAWPVVRAGDEVVWVPGLRLAGWARAGEGPAVVLTAELPS